MIAIIDYGMGNVGSIKNMCARLSADAEITNNPREISQAERIILPGVGAFDDAITNLRRLDLVDLLKELAIERKKPLLGICLGMQLLGRSSEEGTLPGLAVMEASTIRLDVGTEKGMVLPHMGWNRVRYTRESVLGQPDIADDRFYFVHSYCVECSIPEDVTGICEYGRTFCAMVEHGNIFGTQFHPEKSHKFGFRILGRFLAAGRHVDA